MARNKSHAHKPQPAPRREIGPSTLTLRREKGAAPALPDPPTPSPGEVSPQGRGSPSVTPERSPGAPGARATTADQLAGAAADKPADGAAQPASVDAKASAPGGTPQPAVAVAEANRPSQPADTAAAPPAASSEAPASPSEAPSSPASRPLQLVPRLRQPEPPLVSVPLTAWRCSGEAVVGLAHRRKGIPCQDAVCYRTTPRPVLVLSDGAGSAVASDLGAYAMTHGIARLLDTLDDLVRRWLDEPIATQDAEERAGVWKERILRHAQGLLHDLASRERRAVRDLRGTLLFCVVGRYRLFWWKVGDGAIVVRNRDGLRVLGDPMQAKGEFANQTVFVDQATLQEVQAGMLRSNEVVGIALMSDGGAERLVAHDGSRVAGRLAQWFDETVAERFTPDRIALAYHEPAMYERTNLDDCSIVLAARA